MYMPPSFSPWWLDWHRNLNYIVSMIHRNLMVSLRRLPAMLNWRSTDLTSSLLTLSKVSTEHQLKPSWNVVLNLLECALTIDGQTLLGIKIYMLFKCHMIISLINSLGFFIYFLFLSDEGPTLEMLDFTIRISSTPTFLYFSKYKMVGVLPIRIV